ncbi:unnamed protein product [Phytophthora fragariaefolia]|uniref:Unnamed protein product n=1 Tax=Phytophthora fragariaefolia TaxID=1490495 RepID=A0A9W6YPL8_9STRA|nr:unnamed protein product [Phytophthora fragariaefolia]
MGSSTGDGETKEYSEQLNAGVKQLGSLNAVPGTLNAGDEASATHSLLAPGWRDRRIVSSAEYAGLSASKLVPASSFSFVDESVQRLASWSVPLPLATDASFQVVGVPASADAIRNGAHFHDGYGGLEVLQTLETFTD